MQETRVFAWNVDRKRNKQNYVQDYKDYESMDTKDLYY